MNKLELKLFNCNVDDYNVYLNDKLIEPKKMDNRNYIYSYDGEENIININIKSKPNELDNNFWLLLYLSYYIFSVLGVFDSKYSKNYYKVNYKTQIDTNKINSLNLIMNNPNNNKEAIRERDDKIPSNETNKYIYCSKLKNRRIITLCIKYIGWIILAMIIMLIGIKK